MGGSLVALNKAVSLQRSVCGRADSDLHHVNTEPRVVLGIACSSDVTF